MDKDHTPLPFGKYKGKTPEEVAEIEMETMSQFANEKDLLKAKVKRLEDILFARGAMEEAPCFCCGYNGPGYYQPDRHPCAKRHHKLTANARVHPGTNRHALDERDALREDAERYRWLRSRRSLDLRTGGTHWTASDGTRFVSTHYLAADDTQHAPAPSLDATIDAARAALDAQPEPVAFEQPPCWR